MDALTILYLFVLFEKLFYHKNIRYAKQNILQNIIKKNL
jgi:hypothetical protein